MAGMTSIGRGDVFLVRLDPTVGSEIRKTRPGVVVSNDLACLHDAVVQVVPVTGLPERDLFPFEARLDNPASGLKKPSRAVANQIRTVSRKRLLRKLGSLRADELRAVEKALATQLGLRA